MSERVAHVLDGAKACNNWIWINGKLYAPDEVKEMNIDWDKIIDGTKLADPVQELEKADQELVPQINKLVSRRQAFVDRMNKYSDIKVK